MRVLLAVLIALMPLSLKAATRADADGRAVEIYRDGLMAAVAEVRSLAATNRRQMLSAGEKTELRQAWGAFLDYLLALDSIGAYHRDSGSAKSLGVTYAAFLAQYRGALEMIDVAEELPGADQVLNEPVPAIGVPAGTYARVKLRWLNVARATEFAALQSLHLLRGNGGLPHIDEDAKYILATGRGKGQMQTARNALKLATSAAFTAWFPVQKGVAEWMGDTKVARQERFLVTPPQIAELARQLQPGDVFLERREWYVSNVGLPRYWPHTALYIGDAVARRRYFDDDGVRAWVREQGRADGDFEAFLQARDGARYAAAAKAQVIEAVSEGVSFTTLDHSASADSFATLRPRTSKRAKAIAIARAFGYIGIPYDFDFDFHTDTSLVCSEVIYKAYEPAVSLPLSKTLGRLNTPPNEIVHEFDKVYGTAGQQFDFVLFLDGHERRGRAEWATLEDFRGSWKRPKWHVVAD
jgi:hypothetical protein